MANEPNQLTVWQPPQTKNIKKYLTYGMWGVGIVVGILFLKSFTPSAISVAAMLEDLTQHSIKLLFYITVLVGMGFFLWELLVPGKSLNRIWDQLYTSWVNKWVYAHLQIDPLTPIYEAQKDRLAKKDIYDKTFSDFCGKLNWLASQRDDFRSQAADADAKGHSAYSHHMDQSVIDNFTYQVGEYTKSADRFDKMIAGLQPTKQNLQHLQQMNNTILARMATDIQTKKAEWAASKQIRSMTSSASVILTSDQRASLANDAMQLITENYSSAIGELDNQMDSIKPMLDSFDVEKGMYSEESIARWNSDATKVIEGPAQDLGTPIQVSAPDLSKEPAAASFGSLIR